MRKILKYVALALLLLIIVGGVTLYIMSRPDVARFSTAELSGRVPVMASQKTETFPTINVPEATSWPAGQAPRAAQGLAVARFAEGLDHPRTMLVLPNGDVLVAESQSPPRDTSGIEGKIMNRLMTKGGTSRRPSANRITLLRDADGDGKAEVRTAYLTGLNSPYGMALVGTTLYVANTDALLAFPYVAGETKMSGKPTKIVDLPAKGTNVGRTQLLRVIEVATLTGKPLSAWHRDEPREARFTPEYLVVERGPALAARIEGRIDAMLDAGWLDEVRGLIPRVPADAAAWNATGYREVRDVVEGRRGLDAVREEVIIRTRQFAKRQRTWFRHQLPMHGVTRVDLETPEGRASARTWWRQWEEVT